MMELEWIATRESGTELLLLNVERLLQTRFNKSTIFIQMFVVGDDIPIRNE